MNTLIISSIDEKKRENIEPFKSNLSFRKFLPTTPSTLNFDIRFNDDRNYVFVFSYEKVALNFFFLKGEELFDLNTLSILNLKRMNIMLSLVKGIGILKRGGPLKYISTEVNSLIGDLLFNDSHMFEVREFNNEELHWQNWDSKLLAITLALPGSRCISVEGKQVESKIRELGLYPTKEEEITKTKIYCNRFKRRVILERKGRIKVALWPGRIGIGDFVLEEPFSKLTERIIEFYEYVEEVLGDFHE